MSVEFIKCLSVVLVEYITVGSVKALIHYIVVMDHEQIDFEYFFHRLHTQVAIKRC